MQTYLIVMLLVLYVDASICYSRKVRYNLPFSFLCAAIWPVMVPVSIIGAVVLTAKYPKMRDEDE